MPATPGRHRTVHPIFDLLRLRSALLLRGNLITGWGPPFYESARRLCSRGRRIEAVGCAVYAGQPRAVAQDEMPQRRGVHRGGLDKTGRAWRRLQPLIPLAFTATRCTAAARCFARYWSRSWSVKVRYVERSWHLVRIGYPVAWASATCSAAALAAVTLSAVPRAISSGRASFICL